MQELFIDSFAGGGGASTGIEMAIGRSVDIAINHDEAAILMHKTNHPKTKHYCENIWAVDPIEATGGRPVGLMWASPDCKHFSKAKGSKPVEKRIRGLAWVVLKWAGKVKPRVIMLENVEEFVTWGPVRKGRPVKNKRGMTFEKFKAQLHALGYEVDHRELRACDYGAPTTRKRFFLIARRDGKRIVWPEPTHGDPNGMEVRLGALKPWRTAAEIIDWSIPCPSIFERKKPLAENTLRRIARGIEKFVLKNPEPFIVNYKFDNEPEDINRPLSTLTAVGSHYVVTPHITRFQQNSTGQTLDNPIDTVMAGATRFGLITPVVSQIGQTGGGDRLRGIEDPLSTVVSKAEHLLVAPFLTQYHSYDDSARGQTLDDPLQTVDTSNRYALVTAFLSKYFSGGYNGAGAEAQKPLPTVTSIDHNAIVTSNLVQLNNHCDGVDIRQPLPTVTAGGGHIGEVRTFLMTYYGNKDDVGQSVNEPLRTITSKDRFGIVTIHGIDYQIVDIGMRMLEPHELFRAQGFPDDYIIDHDYTGKAYSKTQQVARCGNAVCPPIAEALVRANLPEYCKQEPAIAAS
jgi:DNA (cytosine-5)-methyltransferase 1